MIAGVGIAVAFALGWLAGPLGPDGSLESRAAWVLALASLGPIAGWIVQNESAGRARALPAMALVIPAVHLAAPGFAPAAAAEVLLVTGAASIVLARAITRIALRRHGGEPQRRLFSALLLAVALPGPLFMVTWGLSVSIALPGLIRVLHQTPVAAPPTEASVELVTADGLVLRGGYSAGHAGAPGVVLVHGYNDSRRRMASWAELFASRGAHVLRFDHRAQGVSDGTVCTFADREAQDVAMAVRWLAARPGVDPTRVSALGTSMGGGAILAAVALLEPTELRAMALLAPASDYPPIVLRIFPPEPIATIARAMMWGIPHAMGHASPLDLVPARALAGRSVPGVVVHSRSDRRIDPALTEALALGHPELDVHWLDGISHDETPRAAREDDGSRTAILALFGLR